MRGELEQTDSARMEAVRKLEDAQAEWEGVKGKLEAQVMALTDELEAGNESVEIVKVQAVKAQRAVQTTQKALEDTEAKYREHRGRMVAKLAVKFMQSQLRGEFDTWRDLTIASKLDLRMSWMDEERESLESQVKAEREEKERLAGEVAAMQEAAARFEQEVAQNRSRLEGLLEEAKETSVTLE